MKSTYLGRTKSISASCLISGTESELVGERIGDPARAVSRQISNPPTVGKIPIGYSVV